MEEATITSANILIVDDEPANVLLLERILEEDSFANIHSTVDPEEGLYLFKTIDIQLVLLDLQMPNISGFDFLEQMTRPKNSLFPPVLILTAQSDEQTKLRALEAGAQDFLGKPFSIPEVLCRIKNLLQMNRLHTQLVKRNVSLEQQVQERTLELTLANEKLKKGQVELIKRLGRVAEYRDNETGYHVIRMSLAAERLAEAIGMTPEESEMIRVACPMHDLGKIGIPDHILLKPGKLSEEEWKIMMTHSEIGATILRDSGEPLIEMSKNIAWAHHEKWDGTGYPRGLKGEEIPLVARITTLCDVFDALLSIRPYKTAWSVTETIRFIEEQSGKHFDPSLVPLFKEILPEILDMNAMFNDDSADKAIEED